MSSTSSYSESTIDSEKDYFSEYEIEFEPEDDASLPLRLVAERRWNRQMLSVTTKRQLMPMIQ